VYRIIDDGGDDDGLMTVERKNFLSQFSVELEISAFGFQTINNEKQNFQWTKRAT
jgi:hypothetical protein